MGVDRGSDEMNKVDRIFSECVSGEDFARGYAHYVATLLHQLDCKSVALVMELFLDARERGKKIIFIGNGGSAATASHFANDIAIGTRLTEKPFKALSLTDNNAILTALGNDEGYEHIFTKQLEIYMEPGDIVVAISASGNSPNIVSAIEYTRSQGNVGIGLVGFDGGELLDLCDVCIHIKTAKGEYGPVEDLHMILDHLIGSFLYRYVRLNQQKTVEENEEWKIAVNH